MSLFVGFIAGSIVMGIATVSPAIALYVMTGAALLWLYVKVVNEVD